MNYKCPVCNKELNRVDGITNIHLTGDEKYFVLYRCLDCQKYYLIVSMEATVGSGVNYFKFRINLEDHEAEKIKDLMAKCPNNDKCDCSAHKFLDDFDSKNHNRRVILEDEVERWVSSKEIKNKKDYNNKNN
ncbi:MAG: hypothetical protein ACOCP8_09480 [archaeon]